MKICLLVCLVGAFSLVNAEFKCICNVNHPNVPIRKCPSVNSPVNSFIYQKDANNHFHGVIDTSPTTCKPRRTDVKTIPGWVAVDDGSSVGFIFKDVGLLAITCPGNYTQRKDIIIPVDCVEAVHIILHGDQHFAPITNAPTTSHGNMTTLSSTPTPKTRKPTTTVPTTAQTTTTPKPTTMTTTVPTTVTTTVTTTMTTKPVPRLPTCRDDIIFSLALNESVEHFGAKICPNSMPVSAEAVVMEYCGVPAMSHWTKGAKVIDNCNMIPRFTPVVVYIGGLLMGKPAVFHSCQNGGIELIQQSCGSPVTLHLEHRLAPFYYVLTWT